MLFYLANVRYITKETVENNPEQAVARPIIWVGIAIVIDQEKFYNYFPNKPANILYLLVPGFLTKIYSSLPNA